MKKILLLLFILTSIKANANFKDSTLDISLILGINLVQFNNDVSASKFNYGLRLYSISLSENYCLGGKFQKQLTNKKNVSFSLLYSKNSIGYLKYNNTSLNNGDEIKQNLNGLFLNASIQYKTFSWLKINFGLSNYLNIKNNFDNQEIAREFNWYNSEYKSNMKKHSLLLNCGLEFKIHKKVGLEVSYARGLNNLIVLSAVGTSNNALHPQKIRSIALLLNYKL